ncbi:MAG: vitamin K epoxide reductase family protein [Gemmatimonadaceae bacterium]
MTRRMLVALVALAGLFVALYLTLYKLGYIGTLACGTGSCELVQASKWATFLGVPVGAWGVAFYVGVLALALVGVMPANAERIGVSQLLLAMTGTGVLFSAWLTYLELFVIHAICRWCVVSAVLATILFVVAWLDYREVSGWADELAAELRGEGYGGSLRNTAEVSLRAVKPPE